MKNKNTLVVNFYGGPGISKSTMAASVFSSLKWDNIDCELVAEYAKDLVWESRHITLQDQIYIFGKQHHHIFRLLGQVDVIVTDSPLLLTSIYDHEYRSNLNRLVIDEHLKCNNLNFLLKRKKEYNPNGRLHTLNEAINIDNEIKSFLVTHCVNFIEVDGCKEQVENICRSVKNKVENLKK